jgi:hypothetical protein
MSTNLLFRVPILKPHYNQQPRQSQRKAIPKNENSVFHVQGIGQDKRHPDHQNSQVCPAQSLDAFCPVSFDKLGNGTGAHDNRARCSHQFKNVSGIHILFTIPLHNFIDVKPAIP